MFQSQGGGTPNTVTGYLLAPLSQGAKGQVLFLDVAANMTWGEPCTRAPTSPLVQARAWATAG